MRVKSSLSASKKQPDNSQYYRTQLLPENVTSKRIQSSGLNQQPAHFLPLSSDATTAEKRSSQKSYPASMLVVSNASKLSILPMNNNSNVSQMHKISIMTVVPMNNSSALSSNMPTGRKIKIDRREPASTQIISLQGQSFQQQQQQQQQQMENQPIGKIQRLNLQPINAYKDKQTSQLLSQTYQQLQQQLSPGQWGSLNRNPLLMQAETDSKSELEILDDFELFNNNDRQFSSPLQSQSPMTQQQQQLQSKVLYLQQQQQQWQYQTSNTFKNGQNVNYPEVRSPQAMASRLKQQQQQAQKQQGNGSNQDQGSYISKSFLSPQKYNNSDLMSQETISNLQQQQQQQQQQQVGSMQSRELARRSSSAVKKKAKQPSFMSGKNENEALMILQVKAQCTMKKYNDTGRTQQEKEQQVQQQQQQLLRQQQQLSQLALNKSDVVPSVRQSAKMNSNSVVSIPVKSQSQARRLNSMRGQAETNIEGGPEDLDDDEDDDEEEDTGNNQNDVSLDLDDDEDVQVEGNITNGEKRVVPVNDLVASNQLSNIQFGSNPAVVAASTGKQIYLLKSIYPGRPSTVLFPYHKSCQQPIPRDLSRAVACTEIEIKKFDLKYKINGDNPYKCVMKAFEEAGFQWTDESDWNAMWSLPKKDKVKNMNSFQKYNHFPGCWNLGRKDFMWRCLNRLRRQFPKDFEFIPNTYLLCHEGDWDRFCAKREEASKNQLWICKPADQACGRGVKVITKTSKIKRKTNRIISEYIAHPHLINGFKYDLRLYVLVTSYDPLRIYLYEEGLTRFATEPYTTSTKEVSKRYIHLTNYSVNKHAKKFVKNSNPEADGEGSKWSISALKKKYVSLGIDVDRLFARIQDVIIKTCISAEPQMLDLTAKSSEHRNNCYELYGFDILIDGKLKPWILEVNVCPSLSSSSPLDRKIKHSLLVDTLNLIGIQPFEKKKYLGDQKKNKGSSNTRISINSPNLDSNNENSNRKSLVSETGLSESKNTFSKRSGISLHRAKTMMDGNEQSQLQGNMVSSLVKKKKNFSKNINDIQELNWDNCIEKLSPENWEIIFETDEEYHRRGHYERIYPPQDKGKREYYSQFFEFQRFNNLIIHNWMSSSKNFLEKIIPKKYNLNV